MATTQDTGRRALYRFDLVEAVVVGEGPVGPMRAALRVCSRPANLRKTVTIALVVGTALTLINQLDVILRGDATWFTGVKVVLNFCVPFVVSNLGVLAGTRTAES